MQTKTTRGESRERAILAAVIRVLGKRGYDALTVDEVVLEAHASKSTVYRKWPDKPSLVKAALDAHDGSHNPPPFPDTGALRTDLLAALHVIKKRMTPAHLTLMGGLAHAMLRDKALSKTLKSHLTQERGAPFAGILKRARSRQEVTRRASEELLHDVVEAQVLHRLLLGRAISKAFLTSLVDDVLLPMLRRRP